MKQSNTERNNEERNEDIGEHFESDLNILKSQIKEGLAGHSWIQQGPYLICQSCPINHATWVGIDRVLIGFDENGAPIFKAS